MRRWIIITLALCLSACSSSAPGSAASPSAQASSADVIGAPKTEKNVAGASREYPLDFRVRLLPEQGDAEVTVVLGKGKGRLTRLDFHMPSSRYREISADGGVERDGSRLIWTPPHDGGSLHYRYRIEHPRGDAFDAMINDRWAVFRGDDLVPPTRVRGLRGSHSKATLRFELPEGWSVETPWKLSHDRQSFAVTRPDQRFDRPVGWMIAGNLGVRREDVRGMEVSVAAPVDYSARRLDVLGAINALADPLADSFGPLPPKLLVILAPDPMWRGGLSGPRSLYLHAERPLISENGTSTLAHELTHVVTGIRGVDGQDWIAEGLAEYYSIHLLHRAGLLSDARRDKALHWMKQRGARLARLEARNSTGKRTARAVTVFAELDREIRKTSGDHHSLDDLVRALIKLDRRVSLDDLRQLGESLTGHPAISLQGKVFE